MARTEYNRRDYRRAARRLYGLPCVYCGAPADTADHRRPLAHGGTLADGLVPACRACNSWRGAATTPAPRRRRAVLFPRSRAW